MPLDYILINETFYFLFIRQKASFLYFSYFFLTFMCMQNQHTLTMLIANLQSAAVVLFFSVHVIRPPGVTPWGLIKRCCFFIFILFFIVSTFQPRWLSKPTVGVYHELGPLGNRKTVEADFSFSSPKYYRGQKPLIFAEISTPLVFGSP